MVLDDLRPSLSSHSSGDSVLFPEQEELCRLNRELRAISNCNQTLMRAVDEPTLLREICRIVCEEAGYRMAWVGYAEHDEAKTVRPVASAGLDDGYIAAAHLTWSDTAERGQGPGGWAIRDGETVYIQDIESDPRMAPWRESALQRGYRSILGLPLKSEDGKAFGVLLIYSEDTDAVTPDELRLLEELAGDLAFGITVLRNRRERKRVESVLLARIRLLEFAGSHAMDELLTATLDEIEMLTGSAIGFYHFVEPDQVTLSLQNWSTNTLKNMCSAAGKGSHYGIEQAGVWVDCVHERRPVIHNDYASLAHKKGLPEGHAPVVREAVVPIFRGQEIKAIIGVGNKATDYDENDIGIISQLGDLSWDITERKQLEMALRESEQKFRSLAENSPENIFRYDGQCRILYANHQVKKTLLSDGESFLGKTPLEKTPQGHYPGGMAEMERYQATLQRVVATGELADVEMHVPDASGALRTHSVRFTPERDPDGGIVGALAFGRDITEKAKLEEQLRQSQKMEAIGQLAGGVAHDFNNILTAIIGFGNLAKMKMKPDDPQQALIDHILAASDRAAHLTHSLLAFSRKQVLLPKPVDLNAIVQGVGKLLGRLIGEDIELVAQVSEQSLIVMADEGQIEQVLMNLATNARDAMPDGGALTISTESRLLGADFTRAHGYGKAGRYALVTVSDTGKGMDAATRERVFEPFFTTKSPEKGTGLGLSMVYGIIKQHDGFINVYSEPGKGTTFRIYLPLVAMAAEQAHPERSAPPAGGTERLLLAEDEPVVRTLISGILRDFGYHVIEAVDGLDALDKISAETGGIDLMILDVVMPKMSGKDVYDTVRHMGGRQKTLFISGYTADFISRKGIFEAGVQFLAKPVSPFELLKKIRDLLDEKP